MTPNVVDDLEMVRRDRCTQRARIGIAALLLAASCDNLNCYDDTDQPPFPPQPPESVPLPLDTPTATDDGEFRVLLRAPAEGTWPPTADAIALVVEIEAPDPSVELTAAPAFWADDPSVRGDDPSVTPEGPGSFRIASTLPASGVWCLPVDLEAGDRIDGLDVCFAAR